jgi:hypothetical protein
VIEDHGSRLEGIGVHVSAPGSHRARLTSAPGSMAATIGVGRRRQGEEQRRGDKEQAHAAEGSRAPSSRTRPIG